MPLTGDESQQEYRELGKKLEEGVKLACPWPGLREGLGEKKGERPTFFVGGGLSPSS